MSLPPQREQKRQERSFCFLYGSIGIRKLATKLNVDKPAKELPSGVYVGELVGYRRIFVGPRYIPSFAKCDTQVLTLQAPFDKVASTAKALGLDKVVRTRRAASSSGATVQASGAPPALQKLLAALKSQNPALVHKPPVAKYSVQGIVVEMSTKHVQGISKFRHEYMDAVKHNVTIYRKRKVSQCAATVWIPKPPHSWVPLPRKYVFKRKSAGGHYVNFGPHVHDCVRFMMNLRLERNISRAPRQASDDVARYFPRVELRDEDFVLRAFCHGERRQGRMLAMWTEEANEKTTIEMAGAAGSTGTHMKAKADTRMAAVTTAAAMPVPTKEKRSTTSHAPNSSHGVQNVANNSFAMTGLTHATPLATKPANSVIASAPLPASTRSQAPAPASSSSATSNKISALEQSKEKVSTQLQSINNDLHAALREIVEQQKQQITSMREMHGLERSRNDATGPGEADSTIVAEAQRYVQDQHRWLARTSRTTKRRFEQLRSKFDALGLLQDYGFGTPSTIFRRRHVSVAFNDNRLNSGGLASSLDTASSFDIEIVAHDNIGTLQLFLTPTSGNTDKILKFSVDNDCEDVFVCDSHGSPLQEWTPHPDTVAVVCTKANIEAHVHAVGGVKHTYRFFCGDGMWSDLTHKYGVRDGDRLLSINGAPCEHVSTDTFNSIKERMDECEPHKLVFQRQLCLGVKLRSLDMSQDESDVHMLLGPVPVSTVTDLYQIFQSAAENNALRGGWNRELLYVNRAVCVRRSAQIEDLGLPDNASMCSLHVYRDIEQGTVELDVLSQKGSFVRIPLEGRIVGLLREDGKPFQEDPPDSQYSDFRGTSSTLVEVSDTDDYGMEGCNAGVQVIRLSDDVQDIGVQCGDLLVAIDGMACGVCMGF